MILLLLPLLGLIPASIARNKGHSFVAFWMFGMLLFIVALPVAIIMKPLAGPGGSRQCPACRSLVPWDASVCRFCAREIPAAVAGPGWAVEPLQRKRKRFGKAS